MIEFEYRLDVIIMCCLVCIVPVLSTAQIPSSYMHTVAHDG